jgi:hypothetical protein
MRGLLDRVLEGRLTPDAVKWGLKGMPMGGYNTYTTTQSPINKQQQLLNTLFMTTDLLPQEAGA